MYIFLNARVLTYFYINCRSCDTIQFQIIQNKKIDLVVTSTALRTHLVYYTHVYVVLHLTNPRKIWLTFGTIVYLRFIHKQQINTIKQSVIFYWHFGHFFLSNNLFI